MEETVKFLNHRIKSLMDEVAELREANDFKDGEIKKIMKAILDNHELCIGITDKVNVLIIY